MNKNDNKKNVQIFSFQMKFLTIFSVFLVLITIGLVILIIFKSYNFIFKEIAKLYDLDDFQKIDNIENNLENIQLNLENNFANILQTIVNLYKEFKEFTISNETKDYFLFSNEINLTYWNDASENDPQDNQDNMIVIGDNSLIDQKENESLLFLGTYLKNIFFNNNNEINNNSNFHALLISDYDKNLSYFYPGYASEVFNDINQTDLKNFIQKKISQKINEFISLRKILLHDIDYYNDLYLLPYYDDDNYSFNQDLDNLTNIIFNNSNNEAENITIKNIAFMILPKNCTTNGNNVTNKRRNLIYEDNININEKYTVGNEDNNAANEDNATDEICDDDLGINIEKIFLLIGTENKNNLFNDEIISNQNIADIDILRTSYLFPYELIDNQNGNKYLDSRFDKNSILNDYTKENYTSYDKIINDFSLYKNIMVNNSQYDSSVFEFYRTLEKKRIGERETSFAKTLVNITVKDNQNYKAMKAYSPLQIIYETDYFYPIYNIKMHLLILNENSINDLFTELEDIGKNKLLIGSLLTLFIAVIYFIVVIILLFYTQSEIKKPMKRMNVLNNLYYGKDSDNGLKIDEFEEIIKSITFELKYDSDYLNSGEKQEDETTKLEMENFNKDFEKNKIFNILVDKEKINKILEEKNYSNEIINNAHILKIQNDSFVKKSTLFRECIQLGDFSGEDNYEENNDILINKIYFRDKNTLQNQDARFYKIFKNEFKKEFAQNYLGDIKNNSVSDKKTKKKKKKINKINSNLHEIRDIEERMNIDNNISNENNIMNDK